MSPPPPVFFSDVLYGVLPLRIGGLRRLCPCCIPAAAISSSNSLSAAGLGVEVNLSIMPTPHTGAGGGRPGLRLHQVGAAAQLPRWIDASAGAGRRAGLRLATGEYRRG